MGRWLKVGMGTGVDEAGSNAEFDFQDHWH
jgi:hypothetical protein